MSKSRKYGLNIGDYSPNQKAFVVYSRKNTVTLLSGVTWEIRTIPRKTLGEGQFFIYDEAFLFFYNDAERKSYLTSEAEKRNEIKKQLDGFLQTRGWQRISPNSTWCMGAYWLTPQPPAVAKDVESLAYKRSRLVYKEKI